MTTIITLAIHLRIKLLIDYSSTPSDQTTRFVPMSLKQKIALLFLTPILAFGQLLPITDICLVTVDTSLTHNLVVWERSSQIGAIDSMAIFRQDPADGSWFEIDRVDYDSISEYHDYTANPNLRSYAYRIAGIDSIGTLGVLSTPHATMHIAVLDLGNNQTKLIWSPYIGISNTLFNRYQCWSDSTNTHTWNLDFATGLGDMTDTSWTDQNPPNNWQNLHYKIDIDWGLSCESTRANNHNTSRSNKTQPVAPNDILNHSSIQELYLFPNPSNSMINVAFSSLLYQKISYHIQDINGRVLTPIKTIKLSGQYRTNIDISPFSPGIYFLNIIAENGSSETLRFEVIQ